ncbi:hypothetical protein [Paenibacillus sp. CMAA1364]
MAQQIQENFTVEVEDGHFHDDFDLSIVAESIVGVIEHLTVTKLWTGLNTPEELTKEITRIFLYGLKKK